MDSLKRTPPRTRTHSLGDEMHMAKRKRRDCSPKVESTVLPLKAVECVDFIENVTAEVEKMEKLLRTAYKPKKEICEISSKLRYEVELVHYKGIAIWVRQVGGCSRAVAHEKLLRENEDLRRQLENVGGKYEKLLAKKQITVETSKPQEKTLEGAPKKQPQAKEKK